MTALLEDRVAAFVADHPGYTAREIARELRTREQTVREILHSGPFSHNNGPGQSKCWRIGVEAVGAAPTRPQTHKAKVLQLLSDGKAHSYREGYRLGVMLHSRVADLRRDGYDIRCDKADGNYFYTLVGTLDDGGVVPQRPPSSSVPQIPPV